jgi:hypothetical protein
MRSSATRSTAQRGWGLIGCRERRLAVQGDPTIACGCSWRKALRQLCTTDKRYVLASQPGTWPQAWDRLHHSDHDVPPVGPPLWKEYTKAFIPAGPRGRFHQLSTNTRLVPTGHLPVPSTCTPQPTIQLQDIPADWSRRSPRMAPSLESIDKIHQHVLGLRRQHLFTIVPRNTLRNFQCGNGSLSVGIRSRNARAAGPTSRPRHISGCALTEAPLKTEDRLDGHLPRHRSSGKHGHRSGGGSRTPFVQKASVNCHSSSF